MCAKFDILKSMQKQLLLVALLLNTFIFSAQNLLSEAIQKDLSAYEQLPQELVHLHLNKAKYVMGEQIAFSAYVVNKQNLKPSEEAKNLYVQIKDSTNQIVYEDLYLINQGTAHNTIKIDSTFQKGNYTITAFTNWMRNFKEHNYFSDQIQIFDLKTTMPVSENETKGIDIQFLPESGHLINNVLTSVGVIVKNKQGLGISGAQIKITDSKNKLLSSFELNKMGIGKFLLMPNTNLKYKATITFPNGKSIIKPIYLKIEPQGIGLKISNSKDALRLEVKTNSESLKQLSSEDYILMLYSGKKSFLYTIDFKEKLSQDFIFQLSSLAYGINTLTLFNSEKKAIAERIFFNHHNLPVSQFKEFKTRSVEDSIQITLKPDTNFKQVQVSSSILPKETATASSIRTNFLLKPYLKGYIEQPEWYFTEFDEFKIQELDKLLLTQGWSSYDWTSIFNGGVTIKYPVENLLEFEATINKPEKEQTFLIHATELTPPQTLMIPSKVEKFIVDDLIFYDSQSLSISRMFNNALIPANLYLKFKPSTIPNFTTQNVNKPLGQHTFELNEDPNQPIIVFKNDNDVEVLDEVLLKTNINKEKIRERELGTRSFGKVKVVTNEDRKMFGTLARFLNYHARVRVIENQGQFNIVSTMQDIGTQYNPNQESGQNPSGSSAGSNSPGPLTSSGIVMFHNDSPILDKDFFYNYSLEDVDYIEINMGGLGNGFIGSSGTIKIYTSTEVTFSNPKESNPQTFQVPVTFSSQKKYYVPKYSSNTDDFFKTFGVIDWKPNLSLNENGELSFKIPKPSTDYQIIIQGISEEGVLIHDKIDISE